MATQPNSMVQVKHLLERQFNGNAPVEVRETSKSWIFLTTDHVHKLKKQVRDDLQDLTPLRARLDNCLMECDLNRRLAPETYLGIVRLVKRSNGLALGGEGETIDWMVQMQRLPADRMLDVVCNPQADDPVDLSEHIEGLAQKLAAFYTRSPVSRLNTAELVTIFEDQHHRNSACLLNPLFAEYHARFQLVFDALKVCLGKLFPLLEARVDAGWIRDCHGDLRPEHICLTNPPIIYDCLEFNRNLRQVDPFSEIMFLGLEATILGAEWIKTTLIKRLAAGLSTLPEPELLSFYEAQHAVLRTRLCLAHLLVANPKTPEKWLPLGLRYFKVAEQILCSPEGLAN